MDLNLIAAGKLELQPDGTYKAEGLTLNGLLRPRYEAYGPSDGGLCDFLAVVSHSGEDTGAFLLVFETHGRDGVIQSEPHPFTVDGSKRGKGRMGALVAKFTARIPCAEDAVRVVVDLRGSGGPVARREWQVHVE